MRIHVQMSLRGTKEDGIIQHNRGVDKGGGGKSDAQPQKPPVPCSGVAHQQQGQRRKQVTLMHLNAQNIHANQRHRHIEGQAFGAPVKQQAQDGVCEGVCHHHIPIGAVRAGKHPKPNLHQRHRKRQQRDERPLFLPLKGFALCPATKQQI